LKTSDLKEEVEEYMKDFDEKEILDKVEREKRTREPDEDGFVVVKQRFELSRRYHIFL
jgi:6-pyruvoyl-tetrahydropterin synthase